MMAGRRGQRLSPWTLGLVLVLVLFRTAPSQADTLEGVFSRANEAFFSGDFDAASAGYDSLVQAGVRDPDVFFNQGTAHARKGELGRAILAFERAARLAPGDEAIEGALAQAREAIGRRLADKQGEATVRTRPPLRTALVRGFSANTLTVSLWLFNALLFGLLLARQFAQGETRRLTLGMGAAVAGLATVATAAALAVKVGLGEPGAPAVVVGRDIALREGPTARAKSRQPVPEGALGWVVQREGDWALVRLQGGGQGWLSDSEVGTLDPR